MVSKIAWGIGLSFVGALLAVVAWSKWQEHTAKKAAEAAAAKK